MRKMVELDKFPKLKKQVKKVPLPGRGPIRVVGRPLEAVAKLQRKAKDLGERNAIKRNLADHASRERLAAELVGPESCGVFAASDGL